jgi:hypothetical protein
MAVVEVGAVVKDHDGGGMTQSTGYVKRGANTGSLQLQLTAHAHAQEKRRGPYQALSDTPLHGTTRHVGTLRGKLSVSNQVHDTEHVKPRAWRSSAQRWSAPTGRIQHAATHAT